MKCKKVTFQYEGAPKPQLTDVSIKANMAARIAVLGPNGAGKSTLIKVRTLPASCTTSLLLHLQAFYQACARDSSSLAESARCLFVSTESQWFPY